MVRINPPVDFKRIQFLGSSFRGKRAKELQAKARAQAESSSEFLTKETPEWGGVIIGASSPLEKKEGDNKKGIKN